MKPTVFLPPALALVVGAAWLSVQRHSLARLDEQNAALQANLAKAHTATPPETNGVDRSAKESGARSGKAIDWRKNAAQLAELKNGGGAGGLSSAMAFRQQLDAMSERELLDALDEIAKLDLPREEFAVMEAALASALMRKSPEAHLARFMDRLDNRNDPVSSQLPNALSTWAKKDPAAAIAWFDRQIAEGTFDSKSLDGKSNSRVYFEGILIATVLAADPQTAESRLAGLAPEHRKDALGFSRVMIGEAESLPFAELIRKQLPKSDQAGVIASAAPFGNSCDYDKVTAYLDRISASPAERNACVEEATGNAMLSMARKRKPTLEDFERLQSWARKESPGIANQVAGKALLRLAETNRGLKFPEAVDLALQLHDGGGGDEVLMPLIESGEARLDAASARKLAERIADEKRREEYVRYFQ